MISRLCPLRCSWPAPPASPLPPSWSGTLWPGSAALSRQGCTSWSHCTSSYSWLATEVSPPTAVFPTKPRVLLPLDGGAQSGQNALACGTPEGLGLLYVHKGWCTHIGSIVEAHVVRGWWQLLYPVSYHLLLIFCPSIHLIVLYILTWRHCSYVVRLARWTYFFIVWGKYSDGMYIEIGS